MSKIATPNPNCPCDNAPWDGANHKLDLDGCDMCYLFGEHISECDCRAKIASALAESELLVKHYQDAWQEILEAERERDDA